MALVLFIVIGACAGWSTDIFKDPLSFANKSKFPTHAHLGEFPCHTFLNPLRLLHTLNRLLLLRTYAEPSSNYNHIKIYFLL